MTEEKTDSLVKITCLVEKAFHSDGPFELGETVAVPQQDADILIDREQAAKAGTKAAKTAEDEAKKISAEARRFKESRK